VLVPALKSAVLNPNTISLAMKKIDFITGLRGYSAFGVFLIHAGGMGLREYSRFTNGLVDLGRLGVISFFVLSAFTICMSIDKDRFSFKDYMLKRCLRILPLYYVAILVGTYLGGAEYYRNMFHTTPGYSLLSHMTFANIFDYRYQNDILGVEWTIPVEFFYYFLIPIVFFTSKGRPALMLIYLLAAGALSINILTYFSQIYHRDYIDIIYTLSFQRYAFCFAFGIFLYSIRNTIPKSKLNGLAILALILVLLNYVYIDLTYQAFFVTFWVGVLVLFCLPGSWVSKILFENKIIVFLGEISYSLYLTHAIVLALVFKHFDNSVPFQFLALAITIAVSTFTYFAIEKPFINLGKRLTTKPVAASPATTEPVS